MTLKQVWSQQIGCTLRCTLVTSRPAHKTELTAAPQVTRSLVTPMVMELEKPWGNIWCVSVQYPLLSCETAVLERRS